MDPSTVDIMEGGEGGAGSGGGIQTWRLVHVCVFAFLLHLKPSEPHIGASQSAHSAHPIDESILVVRTR